VAPLSIRCPLNSSSPVGGEPPAFVTSWDLADHLVQVHRVGVAEAIGIVNLALKSAIAADSARHAAARQRKAEEAAKAASHDGLSAVRFDVECSVNGCADEPLAVGVTRSEADRLIAAHIVTFPSHSITVSKVGGDKERRA